MPLCKLPSCKFSILVAIACAIYFGFSSGQALAAQDVAQPASLATPRIVERIDESRLVKLKGTVHPLANARNDRGAAPASLQLDRMHLILSRSANQETALRQFIGQLHTPGSASYHKWLTPDQFGKQFGPSDQDITTVETWLTGHGFNVTKVNPGKQTIEFSGNVAQMGSAFHTQIHKYEVNGETHYANAGDPQIPDALAPVIGGFVALNNFRTKSYAQLLGKASYDPKTDKAKPQWTRGPGSPAIDNAYVLAPQDYAVQYDLSPLYAAGTNGTGQSIAIVNDSNVNIDLVNEFRNLFNLPVNPPQVIIDGNDPGVDGINNPDGPNGNSVEAYLDVEWSGAVAPDATIDLVIAADTALESGLVLAAEHAVYSNIAPIISLSFGGCEMFQGSFNQFINNLWEQAAAQGITVLVSSGDAGSAGCDNDNSQYFAIDGQAVNGWASTPYNVAVGGTDFYYSSYNQGQTAIDSQLATYWNTAPNNTPAVSIKGVIPEQPWNNSQYGLDLFSYYTDSGNAATSIAGGSGGASSCSSGSGSGVNGGWGTCTGGYPKPSWQAGTGVPNDKVRDLPDLSLFAANGYNGSFYPICVADGDCQPVPSGGAVQISGVGGTSASTPAFAGVMALVDQKYGRQGQANFVLYPLAAQFPAAFHDVTNGTNSVPCATGSTDCISVTNPITVTDPNLGPATEGEIGTGTTPEYNATAGYDLASGLGTIDAATLVNDWNKVTFASTTTTLTPSETSFTHGTPITISGTVTLASGTPTGSVALITSSTEETQQGQGLTGLLNGSASVFALNGSGAFSGTNSTLPGGSYTIWGSYSGDGTNGMSTSTPVSITVSPEASGIDFNIFSPSGTYTSSSTPGNSVDYGTQLNLSAQVAPNSQLAAFESCTTTCPVFSEPTGTVTFQDNGTALNTALINADGDAEYNAPFSVGSHSVTASYAGDQSYKASTAAAISFTVVKDSPQIQLNASIVDSSNGAWVNGPSQPTVLTVQVENLAQVNTGRSSAVAPPTGTVTLSSSLSGFSGTATLSSAVDPSTNATEGVATFTVPAGSVSGNYNISVTYNGDGNYKSVSNSIPIAIETTKGDGGLTSAITATLSGSISPTTTVTITGSVTGQSGKAAPTGSVYVYSSGYYATGVNIVPGSGDTSTFTINLSSKALFQGTNSITLQYFGDTNYNPSAFVLTAPISNPLSDFSLVPQSTIIAVTAPGDSGTVPINIASVNGFTGPVAITATTNSAIGVNIPASVTLTAGGSQTVNLSLTSATALGSGTFNVLLTGVDSTGKYVHTLGLELVVGGSVAPTPSFALTSNPTSLPIVAGATTGNTSTITVTPSGGFTGAVSLACAVSGPSGATSPATCSIPSSVTISGTTAQTATLTVTTTSTTTTGAYTVTVTGTGNAGAISQTTTVTANVSSIPPSYALTNSGNITVSPGATTGNTSTITVTPAGGFTGAVTLTCTVTPVAASDPATCSFASPSVTISGTTAQTDVLTITTTAATTALNRPMKLFWPSVGGAALAMVFFFGIPARRRSWLSMLGLLAFFVSIAAIGCGGGGSGGGGGGGGNSGTTPGTYTVTVTGTAGSVAPMTSVTLTVN
ncbi:Ig-like domain repeat protein [Acidicapsa acidisoli]|uniref:Ig-like domain repeat protein n=1 Tax=Acidicapsa acidisoli TaxID=1615681 RepID=UPI0021DF8144|nr:Ig-like domain repeat protein [Acidicapsa acidisoli]